jgi:Ulp1 family protease
MQGWSTSTVEEQSSSSSSSCAKDVSWRQHNGCDCGVFMCVMMRQLACLGPNELSYPTVVQADIPWWRKTIALECYAGVLSKDS